VGLVCIDKDIADRLGQAQLPDLRPIEPSAAVLSRRVRGGAHDRDLESPMRQIVAQRPLHDAASPLRQAPEATPDTALGTLLQPHPMRVTMQLQGQRDHCPVAARPRRRQFSNPLITVRDAI